MSTEKTCNCRLDGDTQVQQCTLHRARGAEPANVDFGMRGENMFFKVGNQSFLLDYKPEERDEFDCMKAMLLSAFSRITHGVDRVMAECSLTDWEKEQIHRQAESDAFNDLLGSLKEVCKTFSSTNLLWKDSAVQVMAQRSIARAEAALSAQQPDADGWIPWAGGECPPPVMGVLHRVRFRCGDETATTENPLGWCWRHTEGTHDIVAYRVVTP